MLAKPKRMVYIRTSSGKLSESDTHTYCISDNEVVWRLNSIVGV